MLWWNCRFFREIFPFPPISKIFEEICDEILRFKKRDVVKWSLHWVVEGINFLIIWCPPANWSSGERHRHRFSSSGVRFPGWSNRTQYRQRQTNAAMVLRSCVALTLRHGDEPTTRYTLRRNAAIIMKIFLKETLKKSKKKCFHHQKIAFFLY